MSKAKKLGFGLMRLPLTNPDDAGSVDIPRVCEMVDRFIADGFTYFDTAFMYCNGKSEETANKVLVSRYPRDKFTLATKLPTYLLHEPADCDKVFDIQRERTGVEFFDYYLLHDVNSKSLPAFEEYHCFDWIKEKKAQGLIKNIGFSFHDGPETLDRILTKYPFMEFVQLQINYLDWESDTVQSRACYEVARKHNKPIIIMEPVKGGALANVPEMVETMFRHHDANRSTASWALRFAAGLDGVMMVLSGMSNLEQLEDNMGFMADFVPLNDDEVAMVHRAADMINGTIAIACTGCAYCVTDCLQNIAIPQYFSLYNAEKRESIAKDWTTQEMYYDSLTQNFGKASDCIACGNCEQMCPQHLPIRTLLKDVAAQFEGVAD